MALIKNNASPVHLEEGAKASLASQSSVTGNDHVKLRQALCGRLPRNSVIDENTWGMLLVHMALDLLFPIAHHADRSDDQSVTGAPGENQADYL